MSKSEFAPLFALLLVPCVLCACASSKPAAGGASVQATAPLSDKTSHYIEVQFEPGSLPPVTSGNITVSATAVPLRATEMTSYTIESKVNGHYLLMPSPPQLHTVYRQVGYRPSSDSLQFAFRIDNRTSTDMLPQEVIFSIESEDRTLQETKVLLPTVPSLASREVSVAGPPVTGLQKSEHAIPVRFGLYGVATGTERHNYIWNAGYRLIDKTVSTPATVELVTPNREEAEALVEQLQARARNPDAAE